MEVFSMVEQDSIVPITFLPGRKRSETGLEETVLPYPNGWFCACFSHDLKPGQVLTVPFMGQELVIYRTMSGIARAIDPYCPHLGAHLGHGGNIVGEELVCPFHGMAFNPDGICVGIPSGQKPPTAALTQRYSTEINGGIFIWCHEGSLPPYWQLPILHPEGFSQRRYKTFNLQGLCQDMTENSSDVLHFSYLHGLQDVDTQHQEDGIKMTYIMQAKFLGQQVSMKIVCYGLGFAFGEASFPRLGLIARTQVTGTQTAPRKWTLRMSDDLHIAKIEKLPRFLRYISYTILLPYAHRWFVKTVQEDFEIWNNRKYMERPHFMSGEGNIAIYRRWSAQFYPTGKS
ncbi:MULTISPECIES: Rieske 2Fe-2S domain-containing protein [unclassified Pseudomonas]|uniref:Rieske 2Fe-2S domain-containing protein n=1 Tax=unclassified Pseudomonas TaxID=196821 RepID=UPI000CD0815C|nr:MULTISPECIES: Rieske 2Fe-2S domain-containing protein [unclassified Pseudomonas]POA69729.1 2Fe-2S ferredoxin [Pseudomonas sp. GW531-T4]PWY36503.1 2Fe-2S ferredoxin [Pseudomonas sp. RW409]